MIRVVRLQLLTLTKNKQFLAKQLAQNSLATIYELT